MPEDTVEVYNGHDRPVAVPAEVVLIAQREYRAYLAHNAGSSWEEIAAHEGYPDARAARYSVRRYLEEGKVLVQEWTKAEMLALEIARLFQLQAAVWEGAMKGNINAGMAARTYIMDRVKLLRLDEEDIDAGKPKTIVVDGDGKKYLATLEQIASS